MLGMGDIEGGIGSTPCGCPWRIEILARKGEGKLSFEVSAKDRVVIGLLPFVRCLNGFVAFVCPRKTRVL